MKYEPTIGIVGVSDAKDDHDYYISSSVIGWLRTHGCHIIYIHPLWSRTTIDTVMRYVDGVIFQGAENHPYPDEPVFRTISHILDIVVSGKYGKIPIYGICNGLQSIATYFSGIHWDTLKTFVNNVGSTSPTCFADDDPIFRRLLYNGDLTSPLNYNHRFAISVEDFRKSAKLSTDFQILGTAVSKHAKYASTEFVACMRHKRLPIFASMFHPEKANYEWSPHQSFINRTIPAVVSGENIGAFFVELCRIYATADRRCDRQRYDVVRKYSIYKKRFVYKPPVVFDDPLLRVMLS